jgi:hypothetical protein
MIEFEQDIAENLEQLKTASRTIGILLAVGVGLLVGSIVLFVRWLS